MCRRNGKIKSRLRCKRISEIKKVSNNTRSVGYVDTSTIATQSYVTTAINNVLDGAPAALDTLNELAAAINDDASYASTITTALGLKLDASTYTASDVLDKLKTVDGSGSGLDADLLDGNSSAYYRINIYDASGTLLN